MADDYTVKITTKGDPAGAKAVEQSVDALNKTAAKGGTALKEHGKEAEKAGNLLEEFGHRGGHGREAIEGLERASRGGVSGLLGMAKAAGSLKEIFSVGSFTVLGGVLLAMIPTIVELGEKLFGSGEKAKEAAEKASKAFGEAKSGAENLNEITLEKFKAELDEIKQSAEFAGKMLKQVFDISDQINKKKEEIEMAKIDANPNLNADEKKDRKEVIKARFGFEAAKLKAQHDDQELGAKEDLAKRLRSTADEAEANAKKQRDLLEANRRGPFERLKKEEELEKERQRIISRRIALPHNQDHPAEDAKLRDEQASVQRRLDYLRERDVAASSPGALEDATQLKKRSDQADANAISKEKEAKDAEREFTEARALGYQKSDADAQLRALENQLADVRSPRTKMPEEFHGTATGFIEPARLDIGGRERGEAQSMFEKPGIQIGGKLVDESQLRQHSDVVQKAGDQVIKHLDSLIQIGTRTFQQLQQQGIKIEQLDNQVKALRR